MSGPELLDEVFRWVRFAREYFEGGEPPLADADFSGRILLKTTRCSLH